MSGWCSGRRTHDPKLLLLNSLGGDWHSELARELTKLQPCLERALPGSSRDTNLTFLDHTPVELAHHLLQINDRRSSAFLSLHDPQQRILGTLRGLLPQRRTYAALVHTPIVDLLRGSRDPAGTLMNYALLFEGTPDRQPSSIDRLGHDNVITAMQDAGVTNMDSLHLLGFVTPTQAEVWIRPRDVSAYSTVLKAQSPRDMARELAVHMSEPTKPFDTSVMEQYVSRPFPNGSRCGDLENLISDLQKTGPSVKVPSVDSDVREMVYMVSPHASQCKHDTKMHKCVYSETFLKLLNTLRGSAYCKSNDGASKVGIAYVLLVSSGDIWNVPDLVSAIHAHHDTIYIHVDMSVSTEEVHKLGNRMTALYGNSVCVEQVLRGCWGCPSLAYIMCLGLLRVNMMSDTWSHVQFLSGSSFPIQPPTAFRAHLQHNLDHVLMDLKDTKKKFYGPRYRTVWTEYERGKEFGEAHVLCPTGTIPVPTELGNFKKAELWSTLPFDFVQWMLCSEYLLKALEFFSHSLIPDESLIPTVVGNSPWRTKIAPRVMYVKWDDCSCTATEHLPCELCMAELPTLLDAKDYYFARKFEPNNKDVIEKLKKKLSQLSNSSSPLATALPSTVAPKQQAGCSVM